MTALAKCGFTFDLTFRDASGRVIARETAKNRVPGEGLDAIASAFFAGGPVPSGLYIGLWSGTHIPTGAETAAALGTLVTEVTAYDGAARKAFTAGPVTNGGCNNALALPKFTFNGEATVNGAFISTAAPKGASSGTLLSIVRFPPAYTRTPAAGDYVEVLCGFQFVSM